MLKTEREPKVLGVAEHTDKQGSRFRLAVHKYGPAIALVIAAIALWELLIWLLDVPDYLMPSPSDIARTFKEDWSLLVSNTGVTLKEVAIGFFIAVAAGLSIAVVLHLSPTLKRAIYPILIASQSVPTVVLAPILVILLGFNIGPKLAIIGLFCFFPIVVNGVDGLESVDREYIRMMLTLDADRWSIFRRIEFPSALPLIFSGTRIAATYAAIGAVFGEWSGADAGLGYVMLAATPTLATARILAVVVILTFMALSLFFLVTLIERLTIPWARGGRAMQ